MRYDKRTDDNHREVIDELRKTMPEATVFDASGAGNGFPDVVLGWNGRNYLFEKSRTRQKCLQREASRTSKSNFTKDGRDRSTLSTPLPRFARRWQGSPTVKGGRHETTYRSIIFRRKNVSRDG